MTLMPQPFNRAAKAIIPQKALKFIVGKCDGVISARSRQEIRNEFKRIDYGNLYGALSDLVDRIRKQQFQIKDAREMYWPFHGKVYIAHDKVVWHWPADFFKNDLLEQPEDIS